MDYDQMRRAERRAQSERMYSSDGMKKLRANEAGPKVTAESQRKSRQVDEVAAMGRRHRAEGLKLEQDHQEARNKLLKKSPFLPANFDQDHARGEKALHEGHEVERQKMVDSHVAERHAGRTTK